MTANPSSKVVYALLQKAGITGSQVCLVEVPGGGKLMAQQQLQPQQIKRADISLDYDNAPAPSPTCFGGTKIISGTDTSQHFRKRKMLQEPRLLDTDEAARIVLSSTAAPDSKTRCESENVGLQKAPLESSSYSTVSFDEFDNEEDDDDLLGSSSYYGRKRARLNHLSADEKLTRRKVMNRIAAQQARDRKKQKMEKMETALQRLEVENRYLRCENTELKDKLEKLGSRLNHLLVQLEGGCGQGVSALSGARSIPADRTAAGAGSCAPAHDAGALAAAGSSGCAQRQNQQQHQQQYPQQQQRQLPQQRLPLPSGLGAQRRSCGREVAPLASDSGQASQMPGMGGPQLADCLVDSDWGAVGSSTHDGDILADIGDLLDDQADFCQLDTLLLCNSPDAPSSESGVFSETPLLPGLESPVSDDLSAWLDINN